jgi:hypothetical protein
VGSSPYDLEACTGEITDNVFISSCWTAVYIDTRGGVVYDLTLEGNSLLGDSTSAGVGVWVDGASSPPGITLRSNAFSGFTDYAVSGCIDTLAYNIVSGNPGTGIEVDFWGLTPTGLVTGNTVSLNGGSGIVGRTTVISNNYVMANTGEGINVYTTEEISGNEVTDNGGIGIKCTDALVVDNTIARNRGGGIECSGAAEIANNHIDDNRAEYGAGMMCGGNAYIHNNTITSNSADSHGGGIYLAGGSARIEYNTIEHNRATYHGGGVFCYESHADTIRYNTLFANEAIFGAGIDIYGLSFPIIGNNIISSSTMGFGIWCDLGSYPEVACNDIWANSGGDYGGAISDQTGVNGNISSDPRFCDPDVHDFGLDATSPCLYDPLCGQIGAFGVGCSGSAVDTGPPDDEGETSRPLHVQVWPNPARERMSIRLSIGEPAEVSVKIFNAQGRELSTAYQGPAEAGSHVFQLNASTLHQSRTGAAITGIYFIRAQANGHATTQKVVIMP